MGTFGRTYVPNARKSTKTDDFGLPEKGLNLRFWHMSFGGIRRGPPRTRGIHLKHTKHYNTRLLSPLFVSYSVHFLQAASFTTELKPNAIYSVACLACHQKQKTRCVRTTASAERAASMHSNFVYGWPPGS